MKITLAICILGVALVSGQSQKLFNRQPVTYTRSSTSDGQYVADNSGAYNKDDGKYHPDNSGQYVHSDVKYEHDASKYQQDDSKYRDTLGAGRNAGGLSSGSGFGAGSTSGSGFGGSNSAAGSSFNSGTRFGGSRGGPAPAVGASLSGGAAGPKPGGSRLNGSGLGSGSVSGSGFRAGSSSGPGSVFGSGSGSGSKFGGSHEFAPPSGFGAPANLQQGSAAGKYDNRNYAIIRKIERVEEDGYHYLYETENGITGEEQGKLANRGTDNEAMQASGYFTYTGPDNVVYTVKYTANEDGFQPEGAHLPTPPPIPDAILRALEYQKSVGTL